MALIPEKKNLSKKQFYLLSYTWGLPTTLAGCLTAAALRVTGQIGRAHV